MSETNNEYINITIENIDQEHLCCALGDKKHAPGVLAKKSWMKERLKDGHVFRKLNAQGKVFVEYAPLEKSWTPIVGTNYFYIYCMWVSGRFAGHGYAKELLDYVIADAKRQNKSGICILSSKKKKPFLSEKAFFLHEGFQVVDSIGDYELLALSFDKTTPAIPDSAKVMAIENKELTIYYSLECPFTTLCVNELQQYAEQEGKVIHFIPVDSLEKAKALPCIFNNWAVFYGGKYVFPTLLNTNSVRKIFEQKN
jgi:GNAT superfamily N-acetyltransferase